MKKLMVGVLIGVVATAAAFVLVTRRLNSPRSTTVLQEQKAQATVPSVKVLEIQSLLPTNVELTSPNGPALSERELATAQLSEQLKAYQQTRQQLTPEDQKLKLKELKHAVAAGSPELNVPEVQRDAQIANERLLNKHREKLYKFSGLILEITPHDVTIVIKNTEVVCTFTDPSWKDAGLKVDGYLYACGFFEAYKDEGDFKQISMAGCCTIENFYRLRTTPLTGEEKSQSLKDWNEDKLYKLGRDLGERKLRQPR